jgi:hypothetical protein
MRFRRHLLRSYAEAVRSVLVAKDLGLETGFNVYTETELRQKVTPVAPYLYLLQTHIAPTEITLPFVAVEILQERGRPFELGRATGHEWPTLLHVYARSTGQRDDLADYLADPAVLAEVAVYDYTTTPATYLETALIDETRTLLTTPYGTPAVEVEGSWRYRCDIQRILWTVS